MSFSLARWLRIVSADFPVNRQRPSRSTARRARWSRPSVDPLEQRLAPAGLGAASDQIQQAYGQLPISFEANVGQSASQVQYLARGSGYALFLTADSAVLSLTQPTAASADGSTPPSAAGIVLAMKLVGADPLARVAGQDPQAGTSNYLIGNDPSQWRTNIANYGQVAYQDVYPGVNLVYHGNQQQLEYDFDVAPGADPNSIRFVVQGADSVGLDDQGNLVLHTANGDALEHAPVLYQTVGGVRQSVGGNFVLLGQDQVGFQVGAYDASLPLTIDPTLGYSSLIGADRGYGIVVDSAGNTYITGQKAPPALPSTPGAFQSAFGGVVDAYVTKLNATGTAVLYTTYLGGSGVDRGTAIAVDSAGNAYVTGFTDSLNFPTTAGAVQSTHGSDSGNRDAFVAKLNATGTALAYGTYLGGNKYDEGLGIAVDGSGNAYVTGDTQSTDFRTTAGALKTVNPSTNGASSAFVAKINATGTALQYSTYLGGSNTGASGNSIAVDAAGNAFQTVFGGGQVGNPDGFVAKLNATGSALTYATYLGGNSLDVADGIAIDSSGNAYVTGFTFSVNFPTTAGAFQTARAVDGGNGNHDAFVAKLNATGSALIYGTFFGGDGNDLAFGLAIDALGNAYIVGDTSSTNLPLAPGELQTNLNGLRDAFMAELNAKGTGLLYDTYLGGTGSEEGFAIAVDGSSNAYVTGYTGPADFPTSTGAFSAGSDGSNTFVTKFYLLSIASLSPPSALINSGQFTLTVNGQGFQSDSFVQWNGIPLPTTFLNSAQLQAVVPAADLAQPYGGANVTVVNPTVDAGTSLPKIFYLDAPDATLPTVTAPSATSIGYFSATLGGTVVGDNGSLVKRRGILYAPKDINSNPKLGGNGVLEVDDPVAANGAFADDIAQLNPGSSYAFVAFAINDAGIAYSSVSILNTAAPTGPAWSFSSANNTVAAVVAPDQGTMFGSEISTTFPLTISSLGMYCPTGTLTASHMVAIWTTTGTLLASVTVNPSDTLSNLFRYHALPSPVTIPAGTYIVGALYTTGSSDIWGNSANDFSLLPGITLIGPAFQDLSNFSFPVNVATGAVGYWGADFLVVPTPPFQALQSINFAAPTSPITYVPNQTVTLSATASSGLAVTFTIDPSSTGSGTINGNTLTVTGAGNIVLDADQAGNASYFAAVRVQQTLVVNKANSSTTAVDAGGTFSGSPFSASPTAAGGGGFSDTNLAHFTFTYVGTGSTIYGPSANAPTNAGSYAVTASYAGDANHNGSSSTAAPFLIAKATATVTVTGFSGPYDGAPHGATGTVVGAPADLSAAGTSLNLGASFTDVPGGVANWTFSGGTNYLNRNGTVAITIIDSIAPIATVTSGPPPLTDDATARFVFGGSDPAIGGTPSGVNHLEIRLDSGAFATATSPTTFSGLLEGNHTVQVRAVDNADNVGAAISYMWAIDLTAPLLSLASKPPAQSNNATARIDFLASDPLVGGVSSGLDRIDISMDGAPFATATSPAIYAGLSPGGHMFQARAFDVAGNVRSIAYSWTIDLSAPTETIDVVSVALEPSVDLSLDNDFTRFANAFANVRAGDVIQIHGTLDWSETHALASWAATDYAFALPHVDDVTVNAASPGDGVTGPSDILKDAANADLSGEGPFYFDGLGTDRGWNITGLTISNFDTAFFYSPETDLQGYAGTHLIDNVIDVPSDNADLGQNGAILLGPGANQSIQGNKIYLAGVGGATNSSFGISSFTSGGNDWNNLLIDNNTTTVTTAGANEKILGIGENSGSVGSNIAVTNNTFNGTSGSDPANQQIAFGITSESVAATATNPAATVTYTGNAVHGASEGFVWGDPEASPPYDFTSSKYLPIAFSNTTLANVNVGFVARDGGKATIASTTIANTGMFLFGAAFHAEGAGSVITVADPTTNYTGVQNLKSETSGGLVIFLSVTGGIADVNKAEGNVGVTIFSFPVVLDVAPAADQIFTVDYATSSGTVDGNDYNSSGPATLTFQPGQSSATISVRVFGDFTPESDETFFVNLSNPLLITDGVAAPGHLKRTQATGTIVNDDTTSLSASISGVSHAEGNSGTPSFTFPATLNSAPAAGQFFTVDYQTSLAGTGAGFADGNDFQAAAGTLTFLAGSTTPTGPLTVVVFGDTKVEPNETFNIALSNPQLHFTNAPQTIHGNLGTGAATGTILNDDTNAAVVSVNSVSKAEGTPVSGNSSTLFTTFTFTISYTGTLTSTIKVNYMTAGAGSGAGFADGNDYQGTAGQVTFTTTGASTATATVTVYADKAHEPDEIFDLVLSIPAGQTGYTLGASIGVGTIVNDD
jgi:hypothetical protein